MNRRENVLLSIVVGFVAAHALQVGLPRAVAEGPRAAGEPRPQEMLAVAVNGGQRDMLFLVDPNTHRLAVYRMKDSSFALLAVRHFAYDLKLESYENKLEAVKQTPGVDEVKNAVKTAEEKKEREEREKRDEKEKKPR